jgi:hypothetical protein
LRPRVLSVSFLATSKLSAIPLYPCDRISLSNPDL